MRTARNVYVVNLAISDLMLCLITMPLTLVEILYLTWQFGNMEVKRIHIPDPYSCLICIGRKLSIFTQSLIGQNKKKKKVEYTRVACDRV